MRIVDCGLDTGLSDTRFGSQRLTVTPLTAHAANVVLLRVGAGGRIGTHRAVGHQVFTVIAGSGRVQGPDGAWTAIGAGRAVIWEPGEQHQTFAETDMTVIVSEGADLQVLR